MSQKSDLAHLVSEKHDLAFVHFEVVLYCIQGFKGFWTKDLNFNINIPKKTKQNKKPSNQTTHTLNIPQ